MERSDYKGEGKPQKVVTRGESNYIDESNGNQDNSKEESVDKEEEKPQKVATKEESKEDASSVRVHKKGGNIYGN